MSSPASSSQSSVHRADQRFRTQTADTDTWHSFSFGAHYDPANIAFGPLLAHNDDVISAGGGYEPHRHSGIDIVTYVVSGTLEHTDTAGSSEFVTAGGVQRLIAGSGVIHSERCPHPAAGNVTGDVTGEATGESTGEATEDTEDAESVNVIQMWLASGPTSERASYESGASDPEADWVMLASGRVQDKPLVTLTLPGARLVRIRLTQGEAVLTPSASHVHLFVLNGAVLADGHTLNRRDALRWTATCESQALSVVATPDPEGAEHGRLSELLVWCFD